MKGRPGTALRRLWAGVLLLAPLLADAAGSVAEVEATLRSRPAEALAALATLTPQLQGVARAEALLLAASLHVYERGDTAEAERIAQSLDTLAEGARAGTSADASGLSPRDAAATIEAMSLLVQARSAARRGATARTERLLGEALAMLPAAAPPVLRVRLLERQATAQHSLGRIELALPLMQQAVALADEHAPPWMRAEMRSGLAYFTLSAQQPERARAIAEDASRLAEASGDLAARSAAATTEFIVAATQRRTDDARLAALRALSLAVQSGSQRDEVHTTANLADHYLKNGDPATALALSLRALPLAREIDDLNSQSVALTNAGLATIGLGRHEEGKALVREAMAIEEAAGALTEQLVILQELGAALEQAGLLPDAWQVLSEHRRLSAQVFQRQHQEAVLAQQEAFDADRRQRELAALQVENDLKEATLLRRDLQQRLWIAGLLGGVLLLAVLGLLARRVWLSNRLLRDSNAQLKVASERDALTGLANRRHLLNLMQQRSAAGAGFEGTMLLIDIDHFKQINDQHGHAAGDRVLVAVAERLRSVLDPQDLTVRWGGEEFLVVTAARPAPEAERLADRVLAAIGREPVALGTTSVAVTASIGFATFPLPPLRRPLGWERAIDLVDTAMYLAKAHGRNRAYGVRALHDTDTAGPAAPAPQPATLEAAWRDGRADLAHLAGPVR